MEHTTERIRGFGGETRISHRSDRDLERVQVKKHTDRSRKLVYEAVPNKWQGQGN